MPSSRRAAKASAAAEGASSHWTSSIATRTGCRAASARSAIEAARARQRAVGGALPGRSARSSATSSACTLRPADRPARPTSTPSNRSIRPRTAAAPRHRSAAPTSTRPCGRAPPRRPPPKAWSCRSPGPAREDERPHRGRRAVEHLGDHRELGVARDESHLGMMTAEGPVGHRSKRRLGGSAAQVHRRDHRLAARHHLRRARQLGADVRWRARAASSGSRPTTSPPGPAGRAGRSVPSSSGRPMPTTSASATPVARRAGAARTCGRRSRSCPALFFATDDHRAVVVLAGDQLVDEAAGRVARRR